MKPVSWDPEKSDGLKKSRGVSFEEIIHADLLAVKEHPRRKHQRLMLFDYRGYVWVVPFVETKKGIFLKTLFPSRKYTKLLKKGLNEIGKTRQERKSD